MGSFPGGSPRRQKRAASRGRSWNPEPSCRETNVVANGPMQADERLQVGRSLTRSLFYLKVNSFHFPLDAAAEATSDFPGNGCCLGRLRLCCLLLAKHLLPLVGSLFWTGLDPSPSPQTRGVDAMEAPTSRSFSCPGGAGPPLQRPAGPTGPPLCRGPRPHYRGGLCHPPEHTRRSCICTFAEQWQFHRRGGGGGGVGGNPAVTDVGEGGGAAHGGESEAAARLWAGPALHAGTVSAEWTDRNAADELFLLIWETLMLRGPCEL